MDNSTVSSSIQHPDKNSTLTLVLIGVIIIICLGFIVVIIGYVGLTTGTNNPTNANNQTLNTVNSTTNTTDSSSLVAQTPKVTITSPDLDSLVNGKITVKGSATYHFSNLKVEIFDDEDNRIGTTNVSISSISDAPNSWEANLDVIESPRASTGKLIVSSTEPESTESVSIKFEIYSQSPANLIIYSPLENQVMFSNDLYIHGEAKGLFEGNLQMRLKDSEDSVIYSGFTTIGDQYEAFKPFDIDITIDNLSDAVGDTGVWEFYYQSMKDGTEVVMQSIPVRF